MVAVVLIYTKVVKHEIMEEEKKDDELEEEEKYDVMEALAFTELSDDVDTHGDDDDDDIAAFEL